MSLAVEARLASLRQTLARLDRGPEPRAANIFAKDTGRTALQPLFAAGQAFGGLHEIVAAQSQDVFTAAGFALDFAAACSQMRPRAGLVIIIEDIVVWEDGIPYGPGFAAVGIDPARLIVVRTHNAKETLLAMETALRSRAVASVIAESAITPKLYDLATSRRLLLAARTGGGAALLVPTAFAGKATRLSSAATARFEIRRARSRPVAFERARVPMPGRPAFAFRLLKAPGAMTDAAARSREQWRTSVFGVPLSEAAFHAFSVDPSAVPANRTDPAPREPNWMRRTA